MNKKSLKTLEYNKIVDQLVEKAVSPMGKELASQISPTNNIVDIRSYQQETEEAVSLILRKGSLPLGGITDLRQTVKRVLVNGVLSIEELMNVGEFLYVCRKVNKYGTTDLKENICEMLDPQFETVETIPALEKEIARCIINSTEIADDASQKLYDLRRSIKSNNSKIKEQLNAIIRSQNYKNMLQESVITMRNERYCVPIKSEYRGSFPGMVHDQSATGATVFIEPMTVVDVNNKIKELYSEERKEINKILMDLSYKVGEHHDIISSNLEVLTHLDFVFAKGELALSMNATKPVINNNGYINIKKGRHPLLDKKTVVPTDIYLGKDFTMLLITGPNTGGKTVSLKTLGLFTLMGQSGLHIAANDNSELAIFDDIFADIGDEQSIEQSLSTFSGHMTNIVRILDEVTDNSLVLLDELGAGTDPTEGAALAVSILQYLHDREIRTAVTTHYSELKVYALSTDKVENASCEFDVETLRPTYNLLIGIPGKSNAFAISRRLGLPEYIINDAKKSLSNQDERFEDVITDLEINRKTVLLEQERAEQFRIEAEKLKVEFIAQKEKLEKQKNTIIANAKEEAKITLAKAKEEADTLIKELHKQINGKASNKEIEATRASLGEKLNSVTGDLNDLKKPKQSLKKATKSVKIGDKVFIHSLSQVGIVSKPPNAVGDVIVQAGIMKITVNLSDLSLDETVEPKKKPQKSYSNKSSKGKALNIQSELDLRGMMVDEGVSTVDKYLDDAYLSGLKQVMIIHGKGTGALRAGIHKHLKRQASVKSFRLGVYGEGEDGVTVVELK